MKNSRILFLGTGAWGFRWSLFGVNHLTQLFWPAGDCCYLGVQFDSCIKFLHLFRGKLARLQMEEWEE